MLVLAGFLFCALLLVVWGRFSDLYFYVPLGCFALLIVWIVVRIRASEEAGYERPASWAQAPRRLPYWR